MKSDDLEHVFRSNLLAIRKAKKMSQLSLAKIAKSTQNTISELESGEVSPTLRMIKRLCEALEIDSDVLLTESGCEIFLSAAA
jgi:transcriptional regulator with XRE-family HTH domain